MSIFSGGNHLYLMLNQYVKQINKEGAGLQKEGYGLAVVWTTQQIVYWLQFFVIPNNYIYIYF